jgi:hypothetical protein
MILVFELNWSGTVHAPGNAATVQTIAAGCPGQAIRFYAEPGHLAELRKNDVLAGLAQVTYHAAAIHPAFQGRPGIVDWGRMWHEFTTVRAALADVPRGEPCLVMMISTTATGIAAAALAAGRRPDTYVQIGLHGDLNDVSGTRSRHPLKRAFDLFAALHRPWRRLRFLVLEAPIRDELTRLAPAAAMRTDVLPLPINAAEVPATATRALAAPIRFGFVGQATEAKGISVFLDIARRMKARHGAGLEFDVIGRALPGAILPDATGLIGPISTDYLSRAEFMRRIAAVHYVFLPLFGGYYRLAASGALIDAVTWLKPVIAGRVPIAAQWFAEAGDIGALCDDPAAMEAAVEAIATAPDTAHYAVQVAALRAARDRRTPAALGAVYAGIVRAFFPALTAR